MSEQWLEDKGDPKYSVEWLEEWGLDYIYCGEDLEQAKKICIGKHAEGKNAWISVDVEYTIHLVDEEMGDADSDA